MRHRVKGQRLKRPTPHRLLLLRGLVCDLILHGKVETTLSKAKETRRVIEKLITKAKKFDQSNKKSSQSINAVRSAISGLQNKNAVKKLIYEIAPKYKNTNGGYTRIIKTRNRKGDNAQLAIITFV